MSQTLQPLLHDLLVCLQAPVQCWARYDGQVTGAGAEGVYLADTRVLDSALLTVSGRQPEHLSVFQDEHGTLRAVAVVRHVGGPVHDPSFRLVRTRRVHARGMDESIVLTSAHRSPVTVDVRLDLHSDLARMDFVRQGRGGPAARAVLDRGALVWADDVRIGVRVESPTAETVLDDPCRPALLWRSVTVTAGEPVELTWRLACHGTGAAVAAAPASPAWQTPEVQADDRRLGRLVARAVSDLRALRMVTPDSPRDAFLAAGAPWFFTLFGRDSLWAARMLLPLGTELAAGTLRTLAARQGSRTDPAAAEEPGKIPHELRATELSLGGLRLPPLYYGTIDATPLWVSVLGDAWRWGMPDSVVEPLLPALERCLSWMSDHGDSDGDGFLEYVDRTGTGLANQGWKDSADAVQWRDGHLARGPIALAEVQGYAYEAAVTGAELLEAFGRPGADRWRSWAADLADRFRNQFWVSTAEGDHPAIALDADKRPVDSLTSNIGHLLGTGILDEAESRRIADLVVGPGLNSGFGLRTLSTGAAGYWPLSYHGGTVWPHDTAIVVAGLVRAGLTDAAVTLAEGLLAAAPHFGYRLPELYGGDPAAEAGAPVPYPAACRPQAWSAAAAIAVLTAFLGLAPDVPAATIVVRPAASAPVGALRVRGLRVAGEPLEIALDRDGRVQAVNAPEHLAVRVRQPVSRRAG